MSARKAHMSTATNGQAAAEGASKHDAAKRSGKNPKAKAAAAVTNGEAVTQPAKPARDWQTNGSLDSGF